MKVMSPLSYHKPLNSSVNILVYYVQPMHINTHTHTHKKSTKMLTPNRLNKNMYNVEVAK